jgi:hypothetical protein
MRITIHVSQVLESLVRLATKVGFPIHTDGAQFYFTHSLGEGPAQEFAKGFVSALDAQAETR